MLSSSFIIDNYWIFSNWSEPSWHILSIDRSQVGILFHSTVVELAYYSIRPKSSQHIVRSNHSRVNMLFHLIGAESTCCSVWSKSNPDVIPSDHSRVDMLFHPIEVKLVCWSSWDSFWSGAQYFSALAFRGLSWKLYLSSNHLWAGAHICHWIILCWNSLYHISVESMLKIEYIVSIYYIVRITLLKMWS